MYKNSKYSPNTRDYTLRINEEDKNIFNNFFFFDFGSILYFETFNS